jgi:hypothetical protein
MDVGKKLFLAFFWLIVGIAIVAKHLVKAFIMTLEARRAPDTDLRKVPEKRQGVEKMAENEKSEAQ